MDELEGLFQSSDESGDDSGMASSDRKNLNSSQRSGQNSQVPHDEDRGETREEIVATSEELLDTFVNKSKIYDDEVSAILRKVMQKERNIMEIEMKITLAEKLAKLDKLFKKKGKKLEPFWTAHLDAEKLILEDADVEESVENMDDGKDGK